MHIGEERVRVAVTARDPRVRAIVVRALSANPSLEVLEAPGDADAVVRAVDDSAGGITPRETEVLGLLADGFANTQIAGRLGISTHTVKFHVESLMRRLGAANRAEAVRQGIRRGLLGL